MQTDITISTDKTMLDVQFITSFITQTYWAPGRTEQAMQTCIDNSLNFGIYLANTQIGYARVVTDYVQFAYLMDVFIIDAHQKKGYSSLLIHEIMNHPSLTPIKVWRLATTDAHYLYQKFGFAPLANPDKMMELIK
jgi:GNAT superfamily N-acetyltransferase